MDEVHQVRRPGRGRGRLVMTSGLSYDCTTPSSSNWQETLTRCRFIT